MRRSPHAAQPKAQREAKDARIVAASKPTTSPRPDWMDYPDRLPKAPPSSPAPAARVHVQAFGLEVESSGGRATLEGFALEAEGSSEDIAAILRALGGGQ